MSKPMGLGTKIFVGGFWAVGLSVGGLFLLGECVGPTPPAAAPTQPADATTAAADPPDRLVLGPNEQTDAPQVPPIKLNPAQQAVWNEAVDYTVTDCLQHDEDERVRCERDRLLFPPEYINAMSGDYLGQGNVSYMLASSPALQNNTVQSCAWRMVMAHQGSPHYNDLDTQILHQRCDQLDGTALDSAHARAIQIDRTVAHHHIRPIPVPEIGYDPAKSGDMETQ